MLNQFNCVARVGKKEVKSSKEKNYIQLSLVTDTFDGKENKAVWFYVSVFSKQAEYINKYVNVGDIVSINGELDQYTYTPKDSKKSVSQLQIKAREIQLVSRKVQEETKEESKEELAF